MAKQHYSKEKVDNNMGLPIYIHDRVFQPAKIYKFCIQDNNK
jgi:hypothetical protein